MIQMEQDKQISILGQVENYLRKNPDPTSIDYFQGLFKLTYTYSTPYTDSKNTKEVFYTPEELPGDVTFNSSTKKLIHNLQKARIQESNSFESISSKDKHQKIMQDDVFGKPQCSLSSKKWVYVAEVKTKKSKGYFNQGCGKNQHKHDFGQTYENIEEVGLFLWDKQRKKVLRITIDTNLIPSSPFFLDDEGTQLVFHAYQRQNFGHGLIYCLNRKVKIFRAKLQLFNKQQNDSWQSSNNKAGKEDSIEIKVETAQLFSSDKNQTKIFPKISRCLKYLVYLSGSGSTHTFYKDFVICKKENGQYVESYRLKNIIIGYPSILRNYIITQNERTFAITQTLHNGCQQILKIDLQTAKFQYLTSHFANHSFEITNVYGNLVVGQVTSNKYNTFFYLKQGVIRLVEPKFEQEFLQQIYNNPIHSILVSAKEEQILPEYRSRLRQRPMVVMPHGGPHSTFFHFLTCLRYVLLKMGYYLLYSNFSGSAGYGPQFVAASLGKIGEKDAAQIVQTVKQVLTDHPNIDKSNVHTQGGSFGGFLSAIFASRHVDIFRSAVILNGVLNLAANMWFCDIPQWNTVEALCSPDLHELKKQDYQAMWRQSPTSQSMKVPILQFLGGKDRRVPWRQGLFLDATTKANNVQITTYVYENSGHSLSDSTETVIDITLKTISFFESFLGKNENPPELKV